MVVLDTTLPSSSAIGSANGGVWRSTNGGAAEGATAREVTTGGQAVMPEMPICANCGADVATATRAAAAPAAATTEERPRRRVFSLSIGGITVSSDGGVNVAVGDVTGDGRREDRGEPAVRPRRTQPR